MAAEPAPVPYLLTRALCVVILVIVVVAAAYAAWIGVVNFARIRV